jgi:ubiquitin-protein ligase E3 C
MFWRVLESLSQLDREKLLLFVTACSRPPLLGFRELHPQMRIVKMPESDQLPMAQTCSNILKLPDYNDEKKLKEKLLLAIENNTGFGLA